MSALTASAGANDPIRAVAYKGAIRVACVGDSITQGAGADPGWSYPAQLQKLLGESWEVRNYGVGGRTLLRNGDYPYWKEGAFRQAQDFHPDVVVIMLGTNDTKPQNWSHKAEFRGDYSDLIKTFADQPGKPRIFICRPCPVPEPGNFGINEKAMQEEIPIIDALAKELGTGLIDMHAALEKTPELLPDHVHPNSKGAFVMAAAVYKTLTGMNAVAFEQQTRVNSYFRNHAVLQRDMPLRVWGTAPDGAQVTVDFAGKKATATASSGHWEVTLPKMAPSTQPRTMTVSGPLNKVVAEDLLVGDVWLAGGQSNMERQLGPRGGHKDLPHWKEEVASADHPLIRQFYMPQKPSLKAVEDGEGRWSVCSPETAADFTAIGYYFARDLQPVIKVPVGLIHSSWGGTVAEAWTSPGKLKTLPDFAAVVDGLAAPGTKFNNNTPTALYQGMIAPLLKVPVKGVIWYQGESNNTRAKQYQALFPALIADWREQWQQPALPFLFVQIAPFKDTLPELREAQFMASKSVPHTAMVVTADIGDAGDIHPMQKEPVGQRLAVAARAIAYGEKVEYSGPAFREMKVQGKEVWLAFDHAGGGLVAKDGPLKGFQIAGADKNLVPATAEIRGDKVVVHSDQVASPVAVRYGWAQVPDTNLVNKEGLPASPFRTDPE